MINYQNQLHIYDSVIAYTQFHPRLILLGDPGSGKSTLLRFLAFCFASHLSTSQISWLQELNWQTRIINVNVIPDRNKIPFVRDYLVDTDNVKSLTTQSWLTTAPLPIFITLRDFARTDFNPKSPLALWKFVVKELEKEGLPQAIEPLNHQAQHGKAIFLLDGVDEVPVNQRSEVWQAIDALSSGPYGGNRWVATCRSLSFVEKEAPGSVPAHALKPLSQSQITQFIDRWYRSLAKAGELTHEEAKQKTNSLQAAVQRQRLRPLSENPMLLTIMTIVQTYYGSLPTERARLYQACVETLLLRWQRHKEQSEQDLPNILTQLETNQINLERLLWEIAWQAHRQTKKHDEAADIPEIEVMQIAKKHLGSYGKAEQFLEYTERRAHLLIGRGGHNGRVYTFPHRTFQEYLAACHLASGRRFPREAAKLAAESVIWREVLNLAAGTLVFNQNNREKALDGVAEVLPEKTPHLEDETGWFRVWLAGEMAVVVGREAIEQDEVGQEILPQLQGQLVALLTNARLTLRQRAEAGDALGLLGDPRPGVCTLEPDMIPIPDGIFLIDEEKHETHINTFAITRYPITNAQYRFFVEDGGYTEKWRHCWSNEGWHYRLKDNWMEPRYWQDTFLTIDNKPIIGVSRYEAKAYFNWLSEKTGRSYRLPTDKEWERVARGTDGRRYPWGDSWQEGVANSKETGIGKPTAVGIFPYGKATCGAQDICGNVWEWTLGSTVRGGSWDISRDSIHVLARGIITPHYSGDNVGYRGVISTIADSYLG